MAQGPERRGIRSGITLLALLAAAPASAARAKWDLGLSVDERYDDNIIQLSERDLNRLDNPSAKDEFINRFSISTPDDFLSIPQVSSGVKVDWLRGRATSFDLDASAYLYRENPIKNYESYRLSASQILHKGKKHPTSLEVSYALLPSFYLRNLISDRHLEELGGFPPCPPGISGTCIPRLEATYRRIDEQIQIAQEIVTDRLGFEGTAGRERRDYNRFFDERDSQMPFRQAQLAWSPLGQGLLRLRASFRREDLHAAGDIPETPSFVEEDISSRRRILAGDARLRWGEKGRKKSVRLRYEAERRDYSTMNVNDIFHFGRTDQRRYATLSFRVDLRKRWFLEGLAERDRNRSEFPPLPPGAAEPNDTTDYTENLVQFGFGWEFGFGAERRPGAPVHPFE